MLLVALPARDSCCGAARALVRGPGGPGTSGAGVSRRAQDERASAHGSRVRACCSFFLPHAPAQLRGVRARRPWGAREECSVCKQRGCSQLFGAVQADGARMSKTCVPRAELDPATRSAGQCRCTDGLRVVRLHAV